MPETPRNHMKDRIYLQQAEGQAHGDHGTGKTPLAGPRVSHCSDSKKVGHSYERAPYGDKNSDVGHEIREDHERHPTEQRDCRFLLPSIQEEGKTYRAKK